MALTRAQLLMGNSSQGVVLAGQTQGVRQGVGVIIAADGTISFDSVTATGVLKTNNPTAYNAYVWPTTLGAVGQQLQLGAGGALSWEDPDQIPWTAKGQLIAGTGVDTSTLLNVGVDGSILIADSTQASGLGYTTNFVATTGATSAANIPAGPVGSRPGSPIQGQLRFSTTSGEMEFWDGTSWQTIAGSATGLFVDKTANNGSAVIPAGTQAQRDSSPGAGYFRYDSTLNAMEFYDGTIWQVVVASASGNIFATLAQAQAGTIATLAATPETAVPKDASGMTGSAYIPAGTTAQRPTASNYTGQFRYNTQIPQLEYSDGAAWQPVSGSSILPASLAEAQAGTITTKYSSPQTAVPKDASGMTGSAYIPAGTTAQRPTASNYTGQFRYNTTIPQLEYSDGAAWQPVSGSSILPASLAQAQAGTLTTVYSSPQTAVPKDASGMTGAALIPAGTDAQRPATPVAGMQRYNTTEEFEEVYTGATLGWRKLEYVPVLPAFPSLTFSANTTISGVYECNNLTINAGVTLTVGSQAVVFMCYGDANILGTINANGAGPTGNLTSTGAPPGTQTSANAPPGAGFGANGANIYSPAASLLGSGGAGSFVVAGSGTVDCQIVGGTGGNAGGSVLIRTYGDLTISGTILANGGNGGNGSSPGGDAWGFTGAGGGSGGAVVLHSSGALTFSGLIEVRGGSGFFAGNSGLSGQITFGNGSGGGGGWIILQGDGGLVNTGTTNLTGGSVGGGSSGTGGTVLTGGPGSSYAGKGGGSSISGVPGGNGQLVFSGSPI